jgi:hypothetical protein
VRVVEALHRGSAESVVVAHAAGGDLVGFGAVLRGQLFAFGGGAGVGGAFLPRFTFQPVRLASTARDIAGIAGMVRAPGCRGLVGDSVGRSGLGFGFD